MGVLTQEEKIDKIYDALYGVPENKQMGLVEMVHNHEDEMKSIRDGKKIAKWIAGSLPIIGYSVGKGFEHVWMHFEKIIH